MSTEDKGTCPHCDREFVVQEYGYRVPCPLCGKNLDIFPDDKYFIDTPWGVIGIGKGTIGDSFFMKPILSWMIGKAAAGKEKLKGMGK